MTSVPAKLVTVALVALLAPEGAMAAGVMYLNGPMPLFAAPTPGKPTKSAPAPVPNQDITAPRGRIPVPGEPAFTASLRDPTPQSRSGASYGPGSTFSDELNRKSRAGVSGIAPSVGVSVDN